VSGYPLLQKQGTSTGNTLKYRPTSEDRTDLLMLPSEYFIQHESVSSVCSFVF